MQRIAGRMKQSRSVPKRCLCNDLREVGSTFRLEGLCARPSCLQQAQKKSRRLPGASRCPSGRHLPLEVGLSVYY